jgi:lysophospholipase L1-like esterase
MKTSPRRKKYVLYLLSILIPLVCTEMLARLLLLLGVASTGEMDSRDLLPINHSNPYLYADFYPNTSGLVGDAPGPYVQVHVNSLGFRGRELVADSATMKIICLGNSETFGWCSTDTMTYPYLLEKKLQSRGMKNVAVVNAGVPRSNSFHLVQRLLYKALPLKPDKVIVMVGWNDISDAIAPRPKVKLEKSRLSFIYDAVFDYYKTAVVIKLTLDKLFDRREFKDEEIIRNREHAVDTLYASGLEHFRNALETLVTICRNNHIECILLPLPNFFHENMTFEEKKLMILHLRGTPNLSYDGWMKVVKVINDLVRKVAAEQRATIIDTSSLTDYRGFCDAIHLNDKGNELLADRIVAHFLQGKASERN